MESSSSSYWRQTNHILAQNGTEIIKFVYMINLRIRLLFGIFFVLRNSQDRHFPFNPADYPPVITLPASEICCFLDPQPEPVEGHGGLV